jgi:hypothetical protein
MTVITHCWWQIIVAAIVYFALGAIWFSPKVFGTAWMKSHGIVMDEEKKKNTNMGALMGRSFICTLIFSAAICWICCATCSAESVQSMGLMHCIKVGFLVGLVGATSLSMAYTYQMKPRNAFLTDGFYHIVGSILAAITLHLLGCC